MLDIYRSRLRRSWLAFPTGAPAGQRNTAPIGIGRIAGLRRSHAVWTPMLDVLLPSRTPRVHDVPRWQRSFAQAGPDRVPILHSHSLKHRALRYRPHQDVTF